MRASLQCCFDSGETVGITDRAFEPLKSSFQHLTVVFPDWASSLGVTNRLGGGIRIDVHPEHAILSEWKKAAIDTENDRPQREGHQPRPEVLALLDNNEPSALLLRVFAVGTVFVRLDFRFDLENLETMLGVCESYEWAAYSPGLTSHMLAVIRNVVAGMKKENQRGPVGVLNSLKRKSKTIPSFCMVFETDLPAETSQATAAEQSATALLKLRDYESTEYTRMEFSNHGVFHLGWATNFIEARHRVEKSHSREFERIWHTLELAQVYFTTCEIFRNLLIEMVSSIVDSGGFQEGDHRREVENLRLLALAVSSNTCFEAATQTGEDLVLLRDYDRRGNLKEKRESIVSACEILHASAQDEYNRKREHVEKSISFVAVLISFLTLVSVFADFLGGINWSGSVRDRNILIIGGPAMLLVCYLLWTLLSKRR